MKKPRILQTANGYLYNVLAQQAKNMRKVSTSAEQLLWNEIRNSKLGYKFRRQHVIDQFIVDFYCLEKSLVVEVDGGIHKNQQERDAARKQILATLGCKIIRFTNDEIFYHLNDVLQTIKKKLVA